MSPIGTNAVSGLKAAKDIVAQKATVAKLTHQLGGLKRAIGKAAYERGIDCGEASRKAGAAVADCQTVERRSAEAAESMKRATGIKEKALAAKDVAASKAAHTAAEMRLNSAYDAVGDYVLAHGIVVPGMENQTAQAAELQRQIDALNAQISELGVGLLKNKVGLAAVTCVVLLTFGIGWYVVGGIFGGQQSADLKDSSNAKSSSASASAQDVGAPWKKREEEEKQKLPEILKKCVALADTDPDGAAELLGMQMVSLGDEEAVAKAMAAMPKDDQKKLGEVKRRAKDIWRKRGAEARVANEEFQARGGWSRFGVGKEPIVDPKTRPSGDARGLSEPNYGSPRKDENGYWISGEEAHRREVQKDAEMVDDYMRKAQGLRRKDEEGNWIGADEAERREKQKVGDLIEQYRRNAK